MKAQEKICKNCKFYASVYNDCYGECRRNAPIVDKKWPEVYDDQWCGEFVAKTEGERTYE